MSDALTVRRFEEPDGDEVVALWEACGLTRPWNDPRLDIRRKLAEDAAGFLVGTSGGSVVASVMVGYDGHRGWINYLAVDPTRQGTGWGRAMMEAAEAHLRERGCPKANLQVRTSNVDAVRFYEAIGYARDDVVSYGKRLVADD